MFKVILIVLYSRPGVRNNTRIVYHPREAGRSVQRADCMQHADLLDEHTAIVNQLQSMPGSLPTSFFLRFKHVVTFTGMPTVTRDSQSGTKSSFP